MWITINFLPGKNEYFLKKNTMFRSVWAVTSDHSVLDIGMIIYMYTLMMLYSYPILEKDLKNKRTIYFDAACTYVRDE
jgi:hypothetical protein